MALADLMELSLSKDSKKMGLSEERITAQIPVLRQYIAFWREYPDIFVEFSGTPSISLNFNSEKGKYASDFALDEQDGRLLSGDGYTKLDVTTKSGTLYLSEK